MTIDLKRIQESSSANRFIAAFRSTQTESSNRRKSIHSALIAKSEHVSNGDFKSIAPSDLSSLFEEYDRQCFRGFMSATLKLIGSSPVTFRLSKRMTSNGGSTSLAKKKDASGKVAHVFEIAIAIDMLYQQFQNGDRSVTVSGLECSDRLLALQSVFEHELIHMLELALWERSSCRQGRFQKMARGVFGHTEFSHRMVTRKRRAASDYGIRIGSKVCFEFDGDRYEGFVNRITKRATVLVKSGKGELYKDGHRYRKFYIPITDLKLRSDA